MTDEIELIRDEHGLAVIGDPVVVEKFLTSNGLTSKQLDLGRLGQAAAAGGAALEAGSVVAANSGRWVKLTKESAEAFAKAPAMKGSQPGVVRAIVTSSGKTKHILEIVRSPAAFATNPAMLAGAAGIMSQLAMQQTMDEITDYLAKIDAKVDDVLRAQKDAAVAGMIGAELEIDEAMSIRSEVGWVSDVTWSKVQSVSSTLKATQAYALRQLDAIVEKIEKQRAMGDIADAIATAEPAVQEWLAVLARSFQLQDGMAVLELDRVLTATPAELDRHRQGLAMARQKRSALIASHTSQLVARVDAAAGTANAKVLFHPFRPRAIVQAGQRVASEVDTFHMALGLESGHESLKAKRWSEAVIDVRDGAISGGTDAVQAVGRLGEGTVIRARRLTADIAEQVAERARPKDAETASGAGGEEPVETSEQRAAADDL